MGVVATVKSKRREIVIGILERLLILILFTFSVTSIILWVSIPWCSKKDACDEQKETSSVLERL